MVSFDLSEYTAEVDAAGTLRLLDVIRTCGLEYGKVLEMPQTKKKTPFNRDSSWRVENFFLGQLICLELGNLVTGATPGRLSVGLKVFEMAVLMPDNQNAVWVDEKRADALAEFHKHQQLLLTHVRAPKLEESTWPATPLTQHSVAAWRSTASSLENRRYSECARPS
ncbi:conserved hypothetical protein [Culex quinquefasciatus]|uniref:Uncharacterized protein n=1 Tax=Culex quinquefasciatus TaxID=7176 RepID=B0XGY5_CULQU|nr:conserved hypothetical protein [Culex quinquefasciatus]|eukprot:XP_001868907.1 conserved hypothetical protein [Culex quinquefasciatus]